MMRRVVWCIALAAFMFPLSAKAACTLTSSGETRPTGTIIHNLDHNVLQKCGSDGTWKALTPVEPPNFCTGTANDPVIGELCIDGSIFAGDTNLYVTMVNQGSSVLWKATTGNDDINPDSNTDGAANHTNATVPISTLPAIDLCENLEVSAPSQALGHTDWFLPSRDELGILIINRSAINSTATSNGGQALLSGSYWSSSEFNETFAWRREETNAYYLNNKNQGFRVRCVRRQ